MKEELISLVVNNKKVEEGAECALGASSGTWNAFECRFCINLMHTDFFQSLARASKSPFCFQKVSILQFKMPKKWRNMTSKSTEYVCSGRPGRQSREERSVVLESLGTQITLFSGVGTRRPQCNLPLPQH